MTAIIRLAINSLTTGPMPAVKHKPREWFRFVVMSEAALRAHDREQAKMEVGV